MLPNFRIAEAGTVSDLFRKKDIDTFYAAARHIHNLPYGRNKHLNKPHTVITEGKGTCSTKHSCLKLLAEENNINSIELNMAIFALNAQNTPQAKKILETYRLPYLLEAHVYLSYAGERYDLTHPDTSAKPWEKDVLIEIAIDTDQIGDWKKQYHQSVLEEWLKRDQLDYTLEELWRIRENCIAALEDS